MVKTARLDHIAKTGVRKDPQEEVSEIGFPDDTPARLIAFVIKDPTLADRQDSSAHSQQL